VNFDVENSMVYQRRKNTCTFKELSTQLTKEISPILNCDEDRSQFKTKQS
jgi:hypothetical protein